MDPTIAQAFATLIQSNAAEQSHRAARQSDTAAAVMNSISAGVFQLITQATMPQDVGALNTASHIPTSQPFVTPGFVYNPASQPAGAKQPGS